MLRPIGDYCLTGSLTLLVVQNLARRRGARCCNCFLGSEAGYLVVLVVPDIISNLPVALIVRRKQHVLDDTSSSVICKFFVMNLMAVFIYVYLVDNSVFANDAITNAVK